MWNRLETFYHIVKAGSLTKAVPILRSDQPSLTRKIATLEKEVGAQLMLRSKPGSPLQLTEQGEVVFETAQKALLLIQTMDAELREKKHPKGKVRLSTSHAIANYIIGPLLIEFSNQHPQIQIELLCNDVDIDIIRNRVDLAIRPYAPKNDDLAQEHLFDFKSALYASPNYIEKFGTPKTVEDLDNHRILTYPRVKETPFSKIHWMLEIGREGTSKRVPFYTTNAIEHILRAAEAGIGIVSSYEEIVSFRNSNLVRVLGKVEGPVYKQNLIYPKRIDKLRQVQTLKQFLLKKFSEEAEKI